MAHWQMIPDLAQAAASAIRRRRERGPTRPGWSWLMEVGVEGLRRNTVRSVDLPPPERRAMWESVVLPNGPEQRITKTRVTVGGIPSVWFCPPGTSATESGPMILFFHGGGYVIGSDVTHGETVSRLALAAGLPVLVPNYRLAPEHPFPAPVEDASAIYRALLNTSRTANQIVLAGDSAGGGLSVALMLQAKERGDPLPAGAVLLCPLVDNARDTTRGSLVDNLDADWLTMENILQYRDAYVAPKDWKHPLASPLYADLSGLPPLAVFVGSADILVDQVVEFVDAARAAGVSVDFELVPNMVHDWFILASVEPTCRPLFDDAASAARRFLSGRR